MEFLKLNIQLFAISADATNNTLKSTAGNKGTLYVKFTEANLTEQNIKDNTSTITAYCKFTQDTGSWAQFSKPYLRLYWYDDNEFKNGVELINMNVTALSRYDFEELELTFTVNHKSDGSLKGYAKAKWEYDGTGTLPCQTGYATTAEKTLATVPRASEIVSTDAYIETPPTITITKKSSGFTTTVNYSFGSLTGTIVEKTSKEQITDWVIPTSFYAQIPNDPFAYCTLTAITYNGSTKVGEKTCEFKVTADIDRTRPKVSFTAVDVNEKTVALTSSNSSTSDYVITGQSNVKCTISSITKETNATIKSVKINGIELGSAREYTFNGAITNEFQVVVTDSRGYSNVETKKTLNKITYNPVTIKANVERNQPTDGKVNIIIEGNYTNVNFPMENNYLLLSYKWKEKGANDSAYQTFSISNPTINSDGTYSAKVEGLTGFDYKKVYIFQVTATDRLTSAPKTPTEITLKKGQPVFWWNGEGVYFNEEIYKKNSESDVYENIGGISGGLEKIYPVGSIYLNISDSRNPKDIFGFGTWESIPGRFLLGVGTSTGSCGNTLTIPEKYTDGHWYHGHNYSHTHTVPGSSHSHPLGDAGYACIYYGGSTFYSREITKSNAFTATSYKSVSGTAGTNTKAQGYATTLGGTTGATTPSQVTTNSQSATTTGSTTTIPPYQSVYMWKRTA